ncbi:hypothetical protein [Natrinema versiforme]|uniref:Uncharacterized protein n=1 Tax=Natrinema versiforme TaxID=88724 RepID=A0A4P8WFA5_9EURY|nr:hypothetical protein [Natrinema versiforme]QCS41715.1 hypothetical protein FEJ81_04855 [Natrinema versiforme]
MGDTNFTLIELRFDGDARFGLGSLSDALPFGGTDSSTDLETETEIDTEDTDDESGGTGKSAVGALVALVVLVGIAAAAKRFRGDDEDPELEPEDEPDVIVN